MSKLSFKFLALTAGGTPQPCFGTTTSAAISASQGPSGQAIITVADNAWFQYNGYMLIDPAGSNPETVQVFGISSTTSVITSRPKFSHASGVFVQTVIPCSSVFIQTKNGNAASIYIGSAYNMNTSTGVHLLSVLPSTGAGAVASYWADPTYGTANGMSLANYWFDGTTADSILPSATTE